MRERTYRRRTSEGFDDRPVSSDADVYETEEVVTDEPAAVYHEEPAYDTAVAEHRSTVTYFDSLSGRVNSILGTLLIGLEGLLALRFALVAFGANRNSGFVDFILNVSWPFVRPFDGAFRNRTWDQGIIEVSTLLAMGVWFIVFALIMMLVNAILPRVYEGGTIDRRRVTHA
jgi:hypothetical protein